MEISRREALTALAGASVALAASGGIAVAEDAAATVRGLRVAPGKHERVPLPFDPKTLDGLSERLLVSHYENNYGGALKNLNKVEEELARTTKDTPGFTIGGLRERELTFANSVILHELYFGNLGGSGKAAGTIEKAIAESFDGFPRWEELFRATAMSLAGGSGWAVLDFSYHTGDLRICWSGHHTQNLASGAPLLVLDMYEHAYQMDYGAAAARYVDAFFSNVQWEEVGRRHQRALAAWQAMRS